MRFLVIDDDRALCRSLQIQLGRHGNDVAVAFTLEEGLDACGDDSFDVVFVDLKLPDGSGLDLLKRCGESRAEQLVVVITGMQDMEATIEAVRLGAFDYLRKPLDIDAVLLLVEKARQTLSGKVGESVSLGLESPGRKREIVGADPKIVEVVKEIALLSQNRVPVLIESESGTGKELVARALHEAGTPEEPFVAVNCSAVVSTLLESELFGHEKGAFTGAVSAKVGKLELAGKGTVFFDEIGDMSLDFQAKLLRVLQEREFERVGGVRPLPLEARIIAATNHNLEELAAAGKFRDDLLYRLSVARITLPPLRERREDIALLARHLLTGIAVDLHREITAIEEEALRRLKAYDWPGNVRELENVLTRAALLTRGPVITEEAVAMTIGSRPPRRESRERIETLREAQKKHVHRTLVACGWNITRTAKALAISPTTLRKKIADYRLGPPSNL